ncbi:MAG: hypothetical protein AAGH76_05200 [Pseudomonadota bacterium]
MTYDRAKMALGQHSTLKRAGQAAFAFFFLKGIAWLAAPVVFYYWL